MNREEADGAWCPKEPMNYEKSGTEWIQVSLNQRFVITAIATQGRFGNGRGLEFTEEYYVEYSRDFGTTWSKWKNHRGQTVRKYLTYLIDYFSSETIPSLLSHLIFKQTSHQTDSIQQFEQHS